MIHENQERWKDHFLQGMTPEEALANELDNFRIHWSDLTIADGQSVMWLLNKARKQQEEITALKAEAERLKAAQKETP